MINDINCKLVLSAFFALFSVGSFVLILFEEHEVTENIITYVIHNPDGTQTYGAVVYNSHQGYTHPKVVSSRGTSKLKAGHTLVSSNGTIEIISIKPYRTYCDGGPLSKHKKKY